MDRKSINWKRIRRRTAEILEAGKTDDFVSRAYDLFSAVMLLVWTAERCSFPAVI